MNSTNLTYLKKFCYKRSVSTSSLIVQNRKLGHFFTARPEGSEFPGDSANDPFAVPGMVSDAVTNQ